MSDVSVGKHLKIYMPATYHIEVEGEIRKSRFDRFGAMRITTQTRKDNSIVSLLVGRVRDQAELSGVLNSLYDNHLPILSVKILDDEEGNQ